MEKGRIKKETLCNLNIYEENKELQLTRSNVSVMGMNIGPKRYK